MSRGQYAWLVSHRRLHSHQRLNEEHLINKDNKRSSFEQWLVGFTDGDGNFHISRQGDKWGLSFKLTQSRYNLRILYYIKKELGVGSITKAGTARQYFIRDRKQIESILIPIFDKYPLLTRKYFDYMKLKKALTILNNYDLTKEQRFEKLSLLKNSKPSIDYISPAWNQISLPFKNVKEVKKVMSKSWLVGFVEAEGSFYLVTKESNRIVHGFGISQKLDELVLQAIVLILHIKTSVRYKERHNYYLLDTTNSRAIENIIEYFRDTMKGVKSLEYKIWARSYAKHKGNYEKLYEIRNMIRNLRKKLQDIV